MKKIASAVLLALGAATAAQATDVPVGSRYDGRIQYVNYNAGDVVIVRASPGLGARIVFAADEEILDVASGFTQGWEFSDRRNILYVKPKSIKTGSGKEAIVMAPEAGKWDTNLMVTTNRHMYDFDLKLLPGSGNSGKAPQNQRVAYRIEFKYPKDEAAARAKAADKTKAQAKLDEKPAPRNWSYSMQIGDASDGIAPTMTYDDGRFTYLKFPNNRDFPAVFIVAADESESLVNTHVDKDVLVVHRVARELVLRLGNAVVGVYNDKYDVDGLPPTEGTTAPGVKRVIVGGDEE
jgi:P-type conjugative transfer protein VirB9